MPLAESTPSNPVVSVGGLDAADERLPARCRQLVPRSGIENLGAWLCVAWLVVVVAGAVSADMLPLAEARNPSRAMTQPILAGPDPFSSHPFGTDRQGLDVLGGIAYGARVSLVVGFGATAIGLVMGGTAGVVAGYRRGRVDYVAGLLNDALLAFPPLVLLLAIASVLEPSTRNTALALGALSAPTFFRIARANTITFAQREFVLTSVALGARTSRTIVREVVPNVILATLSYAFIMVAVLIVAEASLSYLGLGIQRPQPTWGNMISAGQTDFDAHPHLVFGPGAVLFLTVLSLNRVGDRARRRLDTRTAKL